MMKQYSFNRVLTLVWCMVLIAAMALLFTGCGSSAAPETSDPGLPSQTFTVTIADLEGNEETFEITTQQTIVGLALLEEGLITGEEGPYGMFILSANGITADWDQDQTYWSFYIDGEYALTGVDQTEITPGASYSLVLTKG